MRQIKEIPAYTLSGFYDSDPQTSQAVSAEMQIHAFQSMDELIHAVDVVDVVVPTVQHYACVEAALKRSRHVFVEKPLAGSVAEAKKLVSLAHEANVKTQVGQVERFNPAFIAVKDLCESPMFIEAHRLAQFNPRGTDVSVVLDLMIHDIDIVLSLVKSGIKRISASGVAIVSDTPDIANARIEFDNGCVANLTASRISMKNMRKVRLFQKDAYISIDMLAHKSEIVQIKDAPADGSPDPLRFSAIIAPGDNKPKKQIILDVPEVKPNNAIRMELSSFAEAISGDTIPMVTIEDGAKALEAAYKVIEKINFIHE